MVIHSRFPRLLWPCFRLQYHVQERTLGVKTWKDHSYVHRHCLAQSGQLTSRTGYQQFFHRKVDTMKFRYIAVTAASFAAAFAANVIAQSAAPTPVVEPALTKHSCTKPEIPDASKKLGAERMNLFIAGFNAYKECVSDFALAQKKIAEQQQSIAQATIASANAAVKEYNDFAEVANKVNAPKR